MKHGMLWPVTSSWNDISVHCVFITIILNLIFRNVIEVKVRFVLFWNACLHFITITPKITKKLMFLTNFAKKTKRITNSLNQTLCNCSVTKTVQLARNCTRIGVCKLCTKASWQIRLTLLRNQFFPLLDAVKIILVDYPITKDRDQIETILSTNALELL